LISTDNLDNGSEISFLNKPLGRKDGYQKVHVIVVGKSHTQETFDHHADMMEP
jgi:hypothetical protein